MLLRRHVMAICGLKPVRDLDDGLNNVIFFSKNG